MRPFLLFLENMRPLIQAGKVAFDDVIKLFNKQFGRNPEGMEVIGIRKEFTKEAPAQVIDIKSKLPATAPYSEKNPKGWMPSAEEESSMMGRLKSKIEDLKEQSSKYKDQSVGDFVSDYFGMSKKSQTPVTDKIQKKLGDVKLYGDETFEELQTIIDTGVHPRTPKAIGGRVGLNKGLVDMMINFVLKNKNLVQEFFSVTPKQVTKEALENMARQNMAGLKKMYNLIAERVGGATKVSEQVGLAKLLKNEGLKFNKHIDDTMDNFFQRSGDIKYDADALTDSFFEGIGSTVDDVTLTERLKVYDAFYKKLAKERYGVMMKKNASKDMYTKTANDELDAMEAAADVGMKEPMGLTNKEIYAKYQDKISDDLLKKIVIDDNPQRRAEVMATLDEALTMMDKGMDKDQILNVIKNTTRTKNSEGGLNYLMGIPKEDVTEDDKLKKFWSKETYDKTGDLVTKYSGVDSMIKLYEYLDQLGTPKGSTRNPFGPKIGRPATARNLKSRKKNNKGGLNYLMGI